MHLNNNEQFALEFMEEYNRRGFGSMNKNDFEVLIFNLLKKYGSLHKLSNHEISLSLQIPETKVKRLSYESDLRYGNLTDEDIREEFFKIVLKSKLKGHLNKIEFIIENKFIRSSIDAQLKKLGHFSDSSFNTEVIKVNLESFAALLEHYYPEKAIQAILEKASLELDNSKLSNKELLHTFLKSIASEAGKKTVELAILIPSLFMKN